MFIAMNRFQVNRGREADFEAVWRGRNSQIATVPGFVEFHLLRGPENEEFTLYASHTVWADRAAFEAWTKSDAFRIAHAGAGQAKGIYRGHPAFEGFEALADTRVTPTEAAA
jgi:heme-degrading monooxygenase HmoA